MSCTSTLQSKHMLWSVVDVSMVLVNVHCCIKAGQSAAHMVLPMHVAVVAVCMLVNRMHGQHACVSCQE